MIYTYLAKSEIDDSFYVGISEDPKKRVDNHNSGKLKTTARKKPWKLVYFSCHDSYGEARQHEKWLKKKSRIYKNKLSLPRGPALEGRDKAG